MTIHRSPRAAALAICLALPLVAPVPAPAAASPPPLRDGRPATFLIGGWNVAGAFDHPEWLVRVHEAGFDYVQNLAHHFDPMYGRGLARSLDSLRAVRPGFDLSAVLYASRGDDLIAQFSALENPTAEALARVERSLRPDRGFAGPSVLGYGLWDEPCTPRQMEDLGRVARFLRRSSGLADRLVFANLYPIAERGHGSCYEEHFARGRDLAAGYAAYLDAYLSQFDSLPAPAPVLSFDHYPFQDPGRHRHDYRDNLSIANQRALAYGRPGVRVPLWVVIQVGTYRSGKHVTATTPTLRHTRLQAWEALAFGAKGISYWTIFPAGAPEGPRFEFGGWDEQGRPGPHVPGLRTLNGELHALGPTLMQLDAVAVFEGDPARAEGLRPDPASDTAPFYRVVRRASSPGGLGDLLVGYLRHQRGDDDYLLVVNRSVERARTFLLDLATRADTIERIDRTTGRRVRTAVAASRLEVRNLAPASAELFRLRDRILEPVPGVLELGEQGDQLVLRTKAGILAVDRATGHRSRVDRMAGRAPAGLALVPGGVERRRR